MPADARTDTRRIGRYCSVAYTHYRSDPRVRREAEAMRDRGASVTVLALREDGRPAVDEVDGVQVHGFPVSRHRGDGLRGYAGSYAAFFVRAAAHLARQPRQYDLVHVHSLPEAMVFAAAAPKLARRPVVLDIHDLSTEVIASRRGEVPRAVALLERASLRFADRVLTVHDRYREMIVERGVKPDRIAVVINTPDDARFELLPAHTPSSPPTLIHHGTLVRRYGVDVLLHALASARERVPGVRVSIVGDGDHRDHLVELVDELGLGDVVEMTPGAVPLEEVPGRIEAADVGVVPFLDDPFTRSILPTKLLEYVRMGRPAIVSRNSVVEHYFDEKDVFFVEPGDVDGVADAILQIAANPGEAAKRAMRAQRFFDRHGWPSAREQMWTFFEEAVQS